MPDPVKPVSHIESFQFSVKKSNSVSIVMFSGHLMDRPGDLTRLVECQTELLSDPKIKYLVLDFSQVLSVSLGIVPTFTQFQKALRFSEIELRLCSITGELKTKLIKLGVIRASELSGNLKDALLMVGLSLRNGSSASPAPPDKKSG